MSGFKGTPGPWFVEDNQTIFPAVQVAGFEDSGNRHLQVVIYSNSQEEDARLIAAAPELLEALVALTANYADVEPGGSKNVDKARAAIAKATGVFQ